MKKYKLYTLLTLSLSLVVLSCGKKEEPKTPPPATYPVTELQYKTITVLEDYPTNIEGIVNSDVRAKVSGYIKKVLVDDGEKVRKGQVLFQLETQSLSQDAGAAKSRINIAQVEVNKLLPLVEKNIISPVQLETAKANLAQAKSNYNSIVATVDYGTIKSPVDGFVGAINFREGTLVSASDSKPLTTVSDISKVYAFFSLNETQYLDFLQNAKGSNLEKKLADFPEVNLVLANGTTYAQKGKIQTSTGQINPDTGTVSFRAIFDNPNHLVTNGNSGTIQIPKVYENAIVIPQSATYEQQGKIMIFTLDKNNKVATIIVKVKASFDNLYVIEAGLKENETIVVSGVGKLKDGMTITPQKITFDEAVKPITPLFKN